MANATLRYQDFFLYLDLATLKIYRILSDSVAWRKPYQDFQDFFLYLDLATLKIYRILSES